MSLENKRLAEALRAAASIVESSSFKVLGLIDTECTRYREACIALHIDEHSFPFWHTHERQVHTEGKHDVCFFVANDVAVLTLVDHQPQPQEAAQ